jgi:hypothetical protein
LWGRKSRARLGDSLSRPRPFLAPRPLHLKATGLVHIHREEVGMPAHEAFKTVAAFRKEEKRSEGASHLGGLVPICDESFLELFRERAPCLGLPFRLFLSRFSFPS